MCGKSFKLFGVTGWQGLKGEGTTKISRSQVKEILGFSPQSGATASFIGQVIQLLQSMHTSKALVIGCRHSHALLNPPLSPAVTCGRTVD